MIQLPKEFTGGRGGQTGWQFHQVMRDGDLALYRKTKGDFETFEVVRVQSSPDRVMVGVMIPARESMPSSETWGLAGWSDQTLQRAKKRFFRLVDERQNGQI